ncbi:Kinesin-like protein KIN-5C [Linum perenne]
MSQGDAEPTRSNQDCIANFNKVRWIHLQQERNPSAAVYLGQSLSSRLEKGVNVQVLLRCRPFSDGELRNNTPHVVTCNDYQREVVVSQNIVGKQIDRVFTFDKKAEYSVKVTFLELYSEEINNLFALEELSKVSLEEKQKKQLPLMQDGKGGVLVRGLEEDIVASASEIFTLLERGIASSLDCFKIL